MYGNVIYSKTVVPANQARDGETPTQVLVTKEENCCAIWLNSSEGQVLLGFESEYYPHKAIERGVDFGRLNVRTLEQMANDVGMKS